MYYVGIDLGGTNIATGIVSEDGAVLATKSVKTGAPRPENEIIADMACAVTDLLKEQKIDLAEVRSIGVGTPGSVDPISGTVLSACNLGFLQTPLVEKLSQYFQQPILLDNDANCATLAEAMVGAGRGKSSVVMVTLGTGIGGGIVLNGVLYGGKNHFAGEFGHMILQANGEPCACGMRGCFEAYASATAFIRDTKRAAEQNRESLLWTCAEQEGAFSGRTAFDAARRGDGTAQAVVERYIEYLSLGCVNIIRMLQPDALIIGGGISHEGDALFVPLRARVMELAYSSRVPEEKRTVLLAASLGNHAGIVGAALLGKS